MASKRQKRKKKHGRNPIMTQAEAEVKSSSSKTVGELERAPEPENPFERMVREENLYQARMQERAREQGLDLPVQFWERPLSIVFATTVCECACGNIYESPSTHIAFRMLKGITTEVPWLSEFQTLPREIQKVYTSVSVCPKCFMFRQLDETCTKGGRT